MNLKCLISSQTKDKAIFWIFFKSCHYHMCKWILGQDLIETLSSIQHDTKKEFYIFQIRYAESLLAICLLCIKCVKITTCDGENSPKISTLENMETTQFCRFPG